MKFARLPVYVCCLTTLVVNSESFGANVSVFSLPGHTDYGCYVGDQVDSLHACGADIFQVQVFPVIDVNGTETACIAVMPYNTVTINYKNKKGSATLRWRLTAPAKWIDPGVAISSPDVDTQEKTFKSKSGKISNNGLDFTIDLREGKTDPPDGKRRITYQHRPLVEYNGHECAAVDPLMVNSEN